MNNLIDNLKNLAGIKDLTDQINKKFLADDFISFMHDLKQCPDDIKPLIDLKKFAENLNNAYTEALLTRTECDYRFAVVVDYVFTIENDDKINEFTITHKYASLLDFLGNPHKKYDFYFHDQIFQENQYLIENYCFLNKEDTQLHEELVSLNLPTPPSIYLLYSLINNEALQGVVDYLKRNTYDINPFSSVAQVSSGEVLLSINKKVDKNDEYLYIGQIMVGNKFFEWVSADPDKLLHVLLDFARKTCGDTQNLMRCAQKIEYQLAHQELPQG